MPGSVVVEGVGVRRPRLGSLSIVTSESERLKVVAESVVPRNWLLQELGQLRNGTGWLIEDFREFPPSMVAESKHATVNLEDHRHVNECTPV